MEEIQDEIFKDKVVTISTINGEIRYLRNVLTVNDNHNTFITYFLYGERFSFNRQHIVSISVELDR